MKTTVRHEADLDALGYFEYLSVRSPEAATRFLKAVDATVEELAPQPGMGRIRRFRGRDLRDIRSWRVNGFENYLIFYRWEGECLDILRIRHGAMRFAQAVRRAP